VDFWGFKVIKRPKKLRFSDQFIQPWKYVETDSKQMGLIVLTHLFCCNMQA